MSESLTSDTRDPQHGGQFHFADGRVSVLTPCCDASGKGSSNSTTGVVCRVCYEDVDMVFGQGWDAATFVTDYVRWGWGDPAAAQAAAREFGLPSGAV